MKKIVIKGDDPTAMSSGDIIKFEFYGKEIIEKTVSFSGNSGRIYLPSNWIDHRVKIIRMD